MAECRAGDDHWDFYLKINGQDHLIAVLGPLVQDQGGYGLRILPGPGSSSVAPLEFRAEDFSTIRRNGQQVEVVLGVLGTAPNFGVVSRDSIQGATLEVRDGGDTAGLRLDYSTKDQPAIVVDGARPLRFKLNGVERGRVDPDALGVQTAWVVFADGMLQKVQIGEPNSGGTGRRALTVTN